MMPATTKIIAAIEIINAATAAVNAASGAISAAQVDNEAEADRLLAEARSTFSGAVSDWDAAGQ